MTEHSCTGDSTTCLEDPDDVCLHCEAALEGADRRTPWGVTD